MLRSEMQRGHYLGVPSGCLSQGSRCLGHQAGRCKGCQCENQRETRRLHKNIPPRFLYCTVWTNRKASRTMRPLKQVQTVLDRLHEELSGECVVRATVRWRVAVGRKRKKP